MSAEHHGEHSRILADLFAKQKDGTADREWPHGRIDGEDDGALVYKIANDVERQVIQIEFAKPTRWIGLDRESAEALRDRLDEGILALRGIAKI